MAIGKISDGTSGIARAFCIGAAKHSAERRNTVGLAAQLVPANAVPCQICKRARAVATEIGVARTQKPNQHRAATIHHDLFLIRGVTSNVCNGEGGIARAFPLFLARSQHE